LEGRLGLDGAGAAVVVAPDLGLCMVSDFAVSADATADPGDLGAPVFSGPGPGDGQLPFLGAPVSPGPGPGDGQLPFLPLDPAPLNPDGPA
jgi:hypothetical protein